MTTTIKFEGVDVEAARKAQTQATFSETRGTPSTAILRSSNSISPTRTLRTSARSAIVPLGSAALRTQPGSISSELHRENPCDGGGECRDTARVHSLDPLWRR